jgi:8-oxo-dGTP pyrophosphatase MutT (NUDIX family)
MARHESEYVATFEQAGAVPYRRTRCGVEFCLITSTEGRWIFPKGNVSRGMLPQKTAVKEALEEAGLRGRILDPPLGSYEMVKYEKTYTLVLFLMEVTGCEDVWEEASFRRRRWATREKAQCLLCHPLDSCLSTAVALIEGIS